MKFYCESKPLAYALNKCNSLVSPSATYPVIRNVLIETVDDSTLRLTSTDMATRVSYYVTEDVVVEKPGKALVDCNSLTAFISAKAGRVESYITPANRLMTKVGANKLSLAQMPRNEFPEEPKLPQETVANLTGKSLIAVLSISFMADQFDALSFLNGTMLVVKEQQLYAMAASQGRLGCAWVHTDYAGEAAFLLPKSTADQLPYFLYDNDNVLIYIKDSKMFFVTDRFRLSCNKLAGNFPYEKILEMTSLDPVHNIKIPANELSDALKAALAVSKDISNKLWKKVSFAIDTDYNLLNITTAEENEIGHMNWSIVIRTHTEQSFSFSIFLNFIYDILKAIKLADRSGLARDIGIKPSIFIGFIEHNGNRLVRIAEKNTNAVFVIAPMGQVEINE